MANPSPGFSRNPRKQITIEPAGETVTIVSDGRRIARSTRALVLTEPPYPAAYYIPFADIDFDALEKSDHSTHCPYKGDASYWSIAGAGSAGRDVMWAYEQPFDETAAIGNHGAFYADRVTIKVD